MKELLLSLSAFLLAFAASVQAFADDQYIRISNVSMLHDGDEVIVVSAKYGVAMSKFQTNKNKRLMPCAISVVDDNLTVSALNDSVAVFTLNQYSGKWRLYNEEKGWLYAPRENNGELLFTTDKNPQKGSILVDFTFDDYANVFISFGIKNNKYLKYTHNSLYFARYPNEDSCDPVQLYRRLKNPIVLDDVRLSDTDDNASFLTDNKDAFARSVVVDRTFSADGGYYTLCLPFDITETDIRTVLGGAQLKCLKSVEKPNADKLMLHFLSVRSVEAGIPCLLKLPLGSADIVNPEFADKFLLAAEPTTVAMKTSGITIEFIGTYTPTVLPADGRYRFLSADGSRLVTPNAKGELKGLRAYFHFSEPVANSEFDSAGILKNISITVDGEEIHSSDATEICDVRLCDDGVGHGQQDFGYVVSGADKAIETMFTLSGVRIRSSVKDLKPGIYITGNGRKIVVK